MLAALEFRIAKLSERSRKQLLYEDPRRWMERLRELSEIRMQTVLRTA
jgi:hypothetical protein